MSNKDDKKRIRKPRICGRSVYPRKQLNMVVDDRLRWNMNSFKDRLDLNRDIIGEHMLEIASNAMDRILEDKVSTAILRRHLINDHQEDHGNVDGEHILRLGEGINTSNLLIHINGIRNIWEEYRITLRFAKTEKDLAILEALDKKLRVACVELAMYLSENPNAEV